jgi:hypothetical protein
MLMAVLGFYTSSAAGNAELKLLYTLGVVVVCCVARWEGQLG